MSRRRLLGIGAVGIAASIRAAWVPEFDGGASMARLKRRQWGSQTEDEGRLRARPAAVAPAAAAPLGLQTLGLDDSRDGLLYVPVGYRPDQPLPLVLMLHGAGGEARGGLGPFIDLADEAGLILLAPVSRGRTWDLLMEGFGPDVAFVDRALAQTFERYAVDPASIAVEGFSDGASYALSIGITNGDLFGHIIAFSPGFAAPATPHGTPRLFVSHGLRDQVLPIDACSRQVVPMMQRAGYDVTYREFDGPHTIPPAIIGESLDWFSRRPAR